VLRHYIHAQPYVLCFEKALSDAPKTPSCPICGKPTEPKFRPFCSPRCKDVDLHRWMSGVYAVPAVEQDDIDETEPPRDRD
jgi:endogenous inhibitor of DNA gyrase (YacG/DUF329 family)